jgi:phenylacetate-CoA ligase
VHKNLSKYLFFYPVTFSKGEPIAFLMPRYRKSQWASAEELGEYQLEKLSEIVTYAYNNSQFYNSLYASAGFEPGKITNLDEFSLLPSISKTDLITSLDQMSHGGHKLFRSSKTTGGSTGQPVKLFKNPMALARERCATARSYEWAGIDIGEPQLRFWGVPHSKSGKLKAWLTDLAANRKRVSAFDLTYESLNRYYSEALRFRPGYMYGYVSVIEMFARHVVDNGLTPPPSLRAVITTSEILSEQTRDFIASAFNVPVFNEYGCGEVGSIAHECEKGSMHVMSDNLYVEIEDDGTGSGEIVVTDLFNYATPMIRYRLGDYAKLAQSHCECGRNFPVLESIHGRAYDVIQLPSGKRVHPEAVIYVFEAIQSETNAFDQFQVVQEDARRILVRIIPNAKWTDSIHKKLLNDLQRDISNDVEFEVRFVDEIKREPSGKLRLVKCDI